MPRFTDSVCQCGLRSSSSSWQVAFYFIFKLARSGVDPRRDCRGEKTSCTQTPWHDSGTHSVIKPLITLISMKIAARQLGVCHSSTGGTGVVLQTSSQPASESTCTPCREGQSIAACVAIGNHFPGLLINAAPCSRKCGRAGPAHHWQGSP